MLQLRRMNDLTPEFPLHNDSASSEDTIVSFLYISRGWSSKCGGYLHLFRSGEQRTPSNSIEPIANRFVAFRTRASHWHSVERVCGWERLSVLALWDIIGASRNS
ncbi:MAG: 2OG-Fe(II) oxygenase [Planctomycetaceae bacterium]|nr:2OG-Fe(II) oxygenase [Planctomycetaceae bacterium]